MQNRPSLRPRALRQIISDVNGGNTENCQQFRRKLYLSEATFNCYAKTKAKFCAKLVDSAPAVRIGWGSSSSLYEPSMSQHSASQRSWPQHPMLQPMRLEEWADELQTLIDSDSDNFADIKLQVESESVPVCLFFLSAIASSHNCYIQYCRRPN